jgi:hypothetical protein
MVKFYKNLCTEQFSRRPLPASFSFNSIDEAKANWLKRDFEEGEMLKVVKSMNCDKASGPNNFSIAFFQAC